MGTSMTERMEQDDAYEGEAPAVTESDLSEDRAAVSYANHVAARQAMPTMRDADIDF